MRTRLALLFLPFAAVALLAAGCGSDGPSLPDDVTLPNDVTVPDGGVTLPSGGGGNDTTTQPDETTTTGDTPTSESPTTETPTTETPTTETPTTETPTSEAPDTTPTTTQEDPLLPEDEGSGFPWWPFALGAIAVAIAIAVVIGRRPKGPSWASQSAEMLAEIDQIATHVAGLAPGGVSMVAAGDAARMATLSASLDQLLASAPDSTTQAALNPVRPQLMALHGAMDAQALSPQEPSESQMADLRAKASALHTVNAQARAQLATPPPG